MKKLSNKSADDSLTVKKWSVKARGTIAVIAVAIVAIIGFVVYVSKSSVSTVGANSPAYGTVTAPVTINYGEKDKK